MTTYLPLSSIRRFEAAKALEAELPLFDRLEQLRRRYLAWEAEEASGPPVRDDYARLQAAEPSVGGPPVGDGYAGPQAAAPAASGPPIRDDYAHPQPEPPSHLPTWDELEAQAAAQARAAETDYGASAWPAGGSARRASGPVTQMETLNSLERESQPPGFAPDITPRMALASSGQPQVVFASNRAAPPAEHTPEIEPGTNTDYGPYGWTTGQSPPGDQEYYRYDGPINRRSPDATNGVAPGQIAQYIRRAAIARGIDPDFAIQIAQWEGGVINPVLQNFGGAPAYGPFQLYEDRGYMGDQFREATGFSPSDPRAWKMAVDYALDNAARDRSWRQWEAATRRRVENQGMINPRLIGISVEARRYAGLAE